MTVNFLRTMILYIVIVVAVRIMGKRQLGELSPTELVITILISNIATLPIEDTNIPLTAGLVSIFTFKKPQNAKNCFRLSQSADPGRCN